MGCCSTQKQASNSIETQLKAQKYLKPRNKHTQFETEGFEGRIEILYHITSPNSAKLIADSGKMIRGKSGMFGGGIYFAETYQIASSKAQHHGAVIEAEVYLGISLICRKKENEMTFTKLTTKYGCDSVKAIECVSNPEYVVYN